MESLINLLIMVFIILGIMSIFGIAFQYDLKELEKTNPKYRKWLKDKYNI